MRPLQNNQSQRGGDRVKADEDIIEHLDSAGSDRGFPSLWTLDFLLIARSLSCILISHEQWTRFWLIQSKPKHCGILIIDISAFCSFVALPFAFTSLFKRETALFLPILQCWAAPHRPASPILIQLQDWRMNPESAAETSVVSWCGSSHVKQGSGATLHGVWLTVGRTWWLVFSPEGGEDVCYRRNHVRLAISYQERGTPLTAPLISYECEMFWSARIITSYGRGKYVGRSVMWVDVGEAGTGLAGIQPPQIAWSYIPPLHILYNT